MAVFRIHDILVWIWIRGSMPLTNGSGSCYFCHLKVDLQHFSKIKSQKDSQNNGNQSFSYYFCMMIEGSGSGSRAGSIPLTSGSGSGSGRPKNMWIRWIRIRIRFPTLLTSNVFAMNLYECCEGAAERELIHAAVPLRGILLPTQAQGAGVQVR